MAQEKVVTWLEGKILFVDTYAARPNWVPCKVVLTYGGIWLMHGSEKTGVPLAAIVGLGREVPKKLIGNVPEYLSIAYVIAGKETTVAITGQSAQLKKLKKYIMFLQLNKKPVYILHPAKVGGAIHDNVQWEQGLLNVVWTPAGAADKLVVQRKSGNVEIAMGAIEMIQTENQKISGKAQTIANIKFSDAENTYNTFILSGIQNSLVEYINDYLKESGVISKHNEGAVGGGGDAALEGLEDEILVALYSGVSALEVPTFMEGAEVDQVEAVYDKLISQGLVELVRLRKDVKLTAKGRNIVNKKMQM